MKHFYKKYHLEVKKVSRKVSTLNFLTFLILVSHFGAMSNNAYSTEYHVSAKANSDGTGTKSEPFKSIGLAVKLALPGDVIIIHEGVYRELIAPQIGGTSSKKAIHYQAAKGAKVEIKGSEAVKGWQRYPDSGNIWQLSLQDKFFGSYNPYRDYIQGDWFFQGQIRLHTGEIFLDGIALSETNSAVTPMRWSCSYRNGVTVILADFNGVDPNTHLVEISARPSCFYPANTRVNFITISGLVFRKRQHNGLHLRQSKLALLVLTGAKDGS